MRKGDGENNGDEGVSDSGGDGDEGVSDSGGDGDEGVGDSGGDGDSKGEQAQPQQLDMSQYVADVLSSRARQPRCHRSHFCDLVPIPDAGYLHTIVAN